METKDAVSLSIKDYLSQKNIVPITQKVHYGMYLSPFREESSPSFKVDYQKNLWFDFGASKGGTFIDLIMTFHQCNFHQAMQIITKQLGHIPSFSFHGENASVSAIQVKKIEHLSIPALLHYLHSRGIPPHIGIAHLKQVHYCVNERNYFALAFPNNSGGYELRSAYFKGCVNKDVSTTDRKHPDCLIFEGFMDYLSHLTLHQSSPVPQSILVLNSLSNIEKSHSFLQKHEQIHAYLDNDTAGKNAFLRLQHVHHNVINCAPLYAQYKDLNEYLNAHKNVVHQQRQRRGL